MPPKCHAIKLTTLVVYVTVNLTTPGLSSDDSLPRTQTTTLWYWGQGLSRGSDVRVISLALPLAKYCDEVRWNSRGCCSCCNIYSKAVAGETCCLHLGQLQKVFCHLNELVFSKQGTVVMHKMEVHYLEGTLPWNSRAPWLDTAESLFSRHRLALPGQTYQSLLSELEPETLKAMSESPLLGWRLVWQVGKNGEGG